MRLEIKKEPRLKETERDGRDDPVGKPLETCIICGRKSSPGTRKGRESERFIKGSVCDKKDAMLDILSLFLHLVVDKYLDKK